MALNTSLKDEIENEIKSSDSSKRNLVIAGAVALVIAGSTGIVWARTNPSSQQEHSTESQLSETSGGQDEQQPDQSPVENIDENKNSPSTTAPAAEPTQANATKPYTPPAQSLDRNKFISDGTKIMQNYNQIVGLLTFTSSMTDSEKVSRIQQAQNLDKQYFNQATNIRGNLVRAEISSGPFMDAVELAENGVSKISVGLVFMGYWASDRSRSTDLEIGLGSVGEGSQILLEFSSSLNGL